MNSSTALFREFVLEDSEEVSLVDRGGKYLQRQGHSASTLEQHRMVTSVKALQRSISSPEVRIGSGEDDHPSITSADSTTWRLDYYKMVRHVALSANNSFRYL